MPASLPRPLAGKLTTTAIVIALAAALGGCGTDRILPPPATPDDYHARHPIVLAEARTSVDLFPSAGQSRLDIHTAKQIRTFTAQYRELGHGAVLVLVPRGGRAVYARSLLEDVRRALTVGGARGVEVATYPVADPGLAAPVRLSYFGVNAKVATQCGQWPSDLGPGTDLSQLENRTYYNFGCATQQMIAAQTSDPRDLVTPRGEEPTDTVMRARDIDVMRKGQDPATTWSFRNTTIGTVGGTGQ